MWTVGIENDAELRMRRQWLAVEQHRLRCVEEWPDSPYKQAVLAAIQTSVQSLAVV